MESHFVIRTYSFCELAQLYNPHIAKNSASIRLRCWIDGNKELSEKLQLQRNTRILKPNQVKLIVEYFDYPEQIIRLNE